MRPLLTGMCAVAVLAAAGCSDTAATTTETPSAPTVAATTTEAGPTRSPRGHIVKAIGEEAAIGYPDRQPVIAWTITELTVDAPCTADYALPAEGHFVSAVIKVRTSPEYVDAEFGGFHPGNYWEIVDADGMTDPHPTSDASYRCHEADWPTDISPSSNYRFRVTFDSPTPHGTLVLTSFDRPDGWEWSY